MERINRAPQEVVDELQENGRVTCTYAELQNLMEFLFLHDSDFVMVSMDSDRDQCRVVTL